MSKIVVDTFLTLDGVMQAPGGPEEDTSNGFTHGGWQAPLFDEVLGEFVGQGIASTEGLLLGRRTYDIFAGYWPKYSAEHPEDAIGATLNKIPKYVASRTLTSVEWQNSTLLGDDVPAAVARLRERPGGELHVIGSGDLTQTLIRHNLVDEYRLMTYPVLLGTGKRLWEDGTVPTALKLVETRSTPAGVIIAVYQPAGEPTYGSF